MDEAGFLSSCALLPKHFNAFHTYKCGRHLLAYVQIQCIYSNQEKVTIRVLVYYMFCSGTNYHHHMEMMMTTIDKFMDNCLRPPIT